VLKLCRGHRPVGASPHTPKHLPYNNFIIIIIIPIHTIKP